MVVHFINFLNLIFFTLGTRLSVFHEDHAREMEGGFILAANHLGFVDALLIYHLAWRDDVIVMVGEKWQKNFFTRWLVSHMGGIFVDRANADYRALREVYRRLKNGGVLVVAPEGTRSPTGGLITPQPGTAYLAAKTRLPILPSAVTGTIDSDVQKHWKRLRRVPISFTFGKPFFVGPLDGHDRNSQLKQYSDEIMCRIGALLPLEHRGVYTDHPRLLELIHDQNRQVDPGLQ